MKTPEQKLEAERPLWWSALLGVIFGKKRGNEVVRSGSPESVEWDKIPRLPLSDIVRSLDCPELRKVWDKRTRILSDVRLKNLLDQWRYHGEPNPQVTLERTFPGYHHDNDAVGLVLLCSYFDWQTPNGESSHAGPVTLGLG